MHKVGWIMYAYNVEDYLRTALDSVLNQTEKDWIMLLNNNGSTDNTAKICQEYIEKDERFIYFTIKKNNCPTEEEEKAFFDLLERTFTSENFEYVSALDSDDYVEPNFIERLYSLGKKHNADMIVAGTEMFYDKNPGVKNKRLPPSCILDKRKMTDIEYIQLYGSIRPYWGKLYHVDYFMKRFLEFPSRYAVINGADTVYNLALIKDYVKTIVSVPEALHHYRIKEESTYFSANPEKERIKEGEILFELGLETAREWDALTERTEEFLYHVYFSHINDLVNFVIRSRKMTSEEKMEYLLEILKQERFYQFYTKFEKKGMELIQSVVASILNASTEREKISFLRFYTTRMIPCKEFSDNAKLSMAYRLSSICDSSNPFAWGNGLLKNMNYQNRKMAISLVNVPYRSEHDRWKQMALEAIEQQELKTAEATLNSLNQEIPLDAIVLYLNIYYNLQKKKIASAIVFSEIAGVFYDDREELMEMAELAWNCFLEK